MKFKVYGRTTVNVITEVEADSPDDALEVALSELNCLVPYVGNCGTDKLVGVDGDNDSVFADDEIEWTSAEEMESDEDESVPGIVCSRCKGFVQKSVNPVYSYQCLDCDEDLYSFEVEQSEDGVHDNEP